MKRFLSVAFAACLLMLGSAAAQAQDKAKASKGTAAEATAMVDKAIAHIKKVGREKAFADFNNKSGAFTDRDLYVVVYDIKGKVLSHGANEKMIGKDVIDLRDNDGKYFVNTDGPDGKLADYEIKYTFGVYPLQQYLIAFPGGHAKPADRFGVRHPRRRPDGGWRGRTSTGWRTCRRTG